MRTFLTSDLHFNHEAIISFCDRPWDSIEAMNQGLIDNWNNTVNGNDRVIVVGDMVMGRRDESLKFVKRLNGEKWLVPGNHDYCHPMHKKYKEWDVKYREAGFEHILPPETHFDFFGFGPERMTKVCHFPYEGDHTEFERHPEWRPPRDGSFLFHGHLHSTEPNIRFDSIEVGTDAWNYRPIDVMLFEENVKRYYDDL